MRKFLYLLFSVALTISVSDVVAQSIPVGYCGIEFTYDAAGNRTKRQYVCKLGRIAQDLAVSSISLDSNGNGIFPNPTTGRFTVFSKKHLEHSKIRIFNVNGQLVHSMIGSGHKIEIDISHFPNGMYILNMKHLQQETTYKIVKTSN